MYRINIYIQSVGDPAHGVEQSHGILSTRYSDNYLLARPNMTTSGERFM
jgi:hypothetical protein